ncbi:MAG: MFS transporter [Syntrophothermus sp.]
MSPGARRLRVAALAIAVGLVLSDSSIVVLALPDIYRELDTSVSGVTWVLISFNLVMAVAAVPAALAARRVGPGRAAAVGLAIFAGAGLACGLADHLSTLIVARCVQALGGAAAVTAALELLPSELGRNERHDLVSASGAPAGSDMSSVGSERRAALVWAAAGATGAALGPAIGGILTELVSWQSIFLVQVPVALAAAIPILAVARHEMATGAIEPELRRTGSPHLLANLALAMVSAAIAAALFLLVLLLIEGWRLSPIGAAIVVSVMPLAALLGSRLGELVESSRARAAAGAILVSGGLAGLALLPGAEVALTVPPQVLVGIGLSLVLSALTETALAGRAPQAIHGGWTISARHAGVVLGLLALTPLFTHEIAKQRTDAIEAGTAVILDSPVQPLLKLDLARRVADRLGEEVGKVPTIGPAFEPLPSDPTERAEAELLRAELQDQLDRGATHAFSSSFGLAAVLGILALIPIGISRRVEL